MTCYLSVATPKLNDNYIILPVILIICTLIPLLSFSITYITYDVKYVPISQNLSTCTMSRHLRKTNTKNLFCFYSSIILIQIIVYENPLSLLYLLLHSDYHVPYTYFRLTKIPRSIYQIYVIILSVTMFLKASCQLNHFMYYYVSIVL